MGRITALVMAGCLLVAACGCSSYRPAQVGRQVDDEAFSLIGTGSDLGRGAVNIAFCWLEIPHEIEASVRENSSGEPFAVVSATFGALLGAVSGTFWAAERAIGGAFEIVLSPFPPYGPVMAPPYPPYLNAPPPPEEEEE